MRTAAALVLCALIAHLGACAPARPPTSMLIDDPQRAALTRFAPLSPADFALLDEAARAARAAEAARLAEPVDDHEKHRYRRLNNEMRIQRDFNAYHVQVPRERHRLPYLIWSLEAAVTADPTWTAAWLRLARYRELLGDLEHALAAYEGAARAAPHDARLPDPRGALAYASVRRAWRLRDLGRSDEGLAIMADLRAARGPGGIGAQIVYGLLLADAGRFREAMQAALDLPPVQVPDIHIYSGINPATKTSSYARNWIQAAAWLGIGEPDMARHALRELNYYQYSLPYKYEYWQDVGLVCELQGDAEEARLAYSTALTTLRATVPFMTWDNFTTPPIIAGVPDVRVPAFSSYDVNLLAGSRFTLGAQLVAECSQSADDSLRAFRGEAAVRHLSICMARGIRPDLALALRGRALYHLGRTDEAEADLRAACDSLAARGADDAGTLLVLGTLLYQDDRIDASIPFLERATAVEPGFAGPWRTLGAAYASLGRDDAALAAMDRAVDLEPGSSQGWYNRGFFRAERGDLERATVDLGVALRLAPGQPQVSGVAQAVARRLAARQGDAVLQRALARSDSLAGALPSVRAGRLEEDFGVIALGREARAVPLIDHAALADSLAAALDESATDADRRRLADALLRSGRPEEAAAVLAACAETENDAADLLLRLRADRTRGDPERAAALVRERPDLADPELWSLAAMICLEHDLREEGLLALDRALRLDPENTGLMRYREFVRSGR